MQTAVRAFPVTHPGKADLVFHPLIPRIYLAAADGAVRIFDVEKPEAAVLDVHQPDAADRAVHSVAISAAGDQLLTGGDSRVGHLWSVSADGKPTHVRILGRGVSPVRAVVLAPRADIALLLSDDANIRMVNLLTDDGNVTLLKGHEGGGRGAAFDPSSSFIVTVGWEGNVCLWDLNGSLSSPIATLPKLLTRADPATGVCSAPHWNSEGSLVAVPTSHGAQIFPRPSSATAATWTPLHTLGTKETTLVRFSPNGLYIATVDSANQVEVWSTTKRERCGASRATDTQNMYTQATRLLPLACRVNAPNPEIDTVSQFGSAPPHVPRPRAGLVALGQPPRSCGRLYGAQLMGQARAAVAALAQRDKHRGRRRRLALAR